MIKGAGTLKHRVELWDFTLSNDPVTGVQVKNWFLKEEIWAEINSLRTDVLVELTGIFDRSYAQAFIRTTIPTTFYDMMILRYDGRNWTIEGQMPDNDRRFTILMLTTLESDTAVPPDQNPDYKHVTTEKDDAEEQKKAG